MEIKLNNQGEIPHPLLKPQFLILLVKMFVCGAHSIGHLF